MRGLCKTGEFIIVPDFIRTNVWTEINKSSPKEL
jgi:hypothetical protein